MHHHDRIFKHLHSSEENNDLCSHISTCLVDSIVREKASFYAGQVFHGQI